MCFEGRKFTNLEATLFKGVDGSNIRLSSKTLETLPPVNSIALGKELKQ